MKKENRKIAGCPDCNNPKYCQLCGEVLNLLIEVHTKFDEDTGVKIDLHDHYWKCPKYSLFNRHSNFSDVPSVDI